MLCKLFSYGFHSRHGETDFEIWFEERWARSRSLSRSPRGPRKDKRDPESFITEGGLGTNERGRKVDDAEYEVGAA